jgi:hypothetical protein
MQQVEVFKITQAEGHQAVQHSMKRDVPHPASAPSIEPVSHGNGTKKAPQKPAADKPVEHKAPVGLMTKNETDWHSIENGFQEF